MMLMNKLTRNRINFWLSNSVNRGRRKDYKGMTILEVMVATLMLVVFTGIVAMVMEFVFRFYGNPEDGSKGVLIDHAEIHLVMDQLVDVLSQPGLSKNVLHQIAFPLVEDGERNAIDLKDLLADACTKNPSVNPIWKEKVSPMSLSGITLPDGYSICIWRTSFEEISPSRAGVYMLQALPDESSASMLPVRRLFCRPRPLC